MSKASALERLQAAEAEQDRILDKVLAGTSSPKARFTLPHLENEILAAKDELKAELWKSRGIGV